MPWPKGKQPSPEMTAKRVASFMSRGAKRRRPDAEGRWTCPTCKLAFETSEFYRSKKTTSGLSSQCKKCHCETSVNSRDVQRARTIRRFCEANRRARIAGAPGKITEKMWLGVVGILGSTCLRCGSADDIEVDHVIPLARGGANEPTNLQPLCSVCNDQKHTQSIDYRTEQQRADIAMWVVEFKRVEAEVANG